MAVVVDASALAEYLVGSPAGIVAARALAQGGAIHLPHLAVVETTSVLRGWVLGGLLGSGRAEAALLDLAALPATRWPAEPLLPRIWELRNNISAYDATYVALAEVLDATLVTADAQLARAIDGSASCAVELVGGFRGDQVEQ